MPELNNSETKPTKAQMILKILGIVILSVLVYLGAAVATGLISVFSNNIDTNTFAVIFDSQITIAYLLMYYSLSHFYKFSEKQTYFLFVATLLLSFTTNFIQGSITLLILPPLLRKLKLIQTA